MMKNRKIGVCVIFVATVFLFSFVLSTNAETVSNININPSLDISRFLPYTITASTTGSPIAVSTSIAGVNGDGGVYWDYYIDGTSSVNNIVKTMTYNSTEDTWTSSNIYPDNIYPEIYFASSDITWNNVPLNTDIRRNSYHLLRFANPFSMVASTSFFVEVNAVPRSRVNSANLSVYIAKKGLPVTFFNSDWRNSTSVELIGSFDKNAIFHHTHVTGKSEHHLITLSSNANGTIGVNNLDISEDFWIILYSDSPNTARGWDLRYHPSSLCTYADRWYSGSQSGWTTATRSGCPDAHIHIARRNGSLSDGVMATVTATYAGGDVATATEVFLFDNLPNLPPSQTSFINPVPGGVYDGGSGGTKTIAISWNPATDANGDQLKYDIYLLDQNGVQIGSALVSSTTDTNFNWNIDLVANGEYSLKGVVCDEAPLCTTFTMSDNFVVQKALPIYSLSNIIINSNNVNSSSVAKKDDTVVLSFTATGDISSTIAATLYFGGAPSPASSTLAHIGNDWTATYIVTGAEAEGLVDFVISAENLDVPYSNTSDNSLVTIDLTKPTVLSLPTAGTYDSPQSVTLTSSDALIIKYTTTEFPGCLAGTTYSSPIIVMSPTIIWVSACDIAGNESTTTFPYLFEYSLLYNSQLGGSISGNTRQFIAYGENGSGVVATEDPNYKFISWSDGLLSPNRNDLNITRNKTFTAFFERLFQSTGSNQSISQARTLLMPEYEYSNHIQTIDRLKNMVAVLQKRIAEKQEQEPQIANNTHKNTYLFTRDLTIGSIGEDVRVLQRTLNRLGFVLAQQGSGSPGNETNRFGVLTQRALAQFQKKYNIMPARGYFGPKTKNIIENIIKESESQEY